ncbi:putative dimethyladenosine transferase [Manis javanica]|nr:putative dimethyladenosine transferase [Manis javanica]
MDYGLSFSQLATISAQDIPICDFSGSPRLVESPAILWKVTADVATTKCNGFTFLLPPFSAWGVHMAMAKAEQGKVIINPPGIEEVVQWLDVIKVIFERYQYILKTPIIVISIIDKAALRPTDVVRQTWNCQYDYKVARKGKKDFWTPELKILHSMKLCLQRS